MNRKIKIIFVLLIVVISVLFVGCSKNINKTNKPSEEIKSKIKIATLKGPTGMVWLNLWKKIRIIMKFL